MCDYYCGDWNANHPGMDYYCPIEDFRAEADMDLPESLTQIPELPMEVVIRIVKMMWRETDRIDGARRLYGAMSQKPTVIHTGDGPCLIMTDPQHRLFGLGWGRYDWGNRHDGIVNKSSHNHLMTDGGCWGDGDPRLGWRPWTSGPGTRAKSIGFGKAQERNPWTDEQRLNWCRQNQYAPSELAYYQHQNWGVGVFTRREWNTETPARQNLPDWLADELMLDERSNNLMPRNLGHYDQSWSEHIKDVGTIIRNQEYISAHNERHALMWIGHAYDEGILKADCQRKHKLLKEIIATVPVYQNMWEDLKAQDHYSHTAWALDGQPSNDPSRGDLTVHHRMGNENHSWVKMREQGENWRKLWNQVLTYKRNGDSVEYRVQKRIPGRPNLMRITTDKKMRSYPSGLGAVKMSKAKYKKIKK
jgi:hypothetical protein